MRRLCALLLLAAACAAGVDWTTYKPQGYVSDFAGVIDAENRQRLEEFSKHFEKATGVEMAFVALPSLPVVP